MPVFDRFRLLPTSAANVRFGSKADISPARISSLLTRSAFNFGVAFLRSPKAPQVIVLTSQLSSSHAEPAAVAAWTRPCSFQS